MSIWELIDTQERDGFTLQLHFAPEEDAPEDHFATDCEDEDAALCVEIRAGLWLWFVARVTASKAGVALGTSYLGGCCYTNAAEFIGCSFDDMALDAIDEARAAIAKLVA